MLAHRLLASRLSSLASAKVILRPGTTLEARCVYLHSRRYKFLTKPLAYSAANSRHICGNSCLGVHCSVPRRLAAHRRKGDRTVERNVQDCGSPTSYRGTVNIVNISDIHFSLPLNHKIVCVIRT